MRTNADLERLFCIMIHKSKTKYAKYKIWISFEPIIRSLFLKIFNLIGFSLFI